MLAHEDRHFIRGNLSPRIVYGFSTRRGGASGGIFKSFNLSKSKKDKDPHSEANWRLFQKEILSAGESLVYMEQRHSADVVVIESGHSPQGHLTGDAVVTGQKGCCIGVFTADCLPVLVFDPVREVIAAIHGGWRPLSKGIVGRVQEKMAARFGSDFAHCLVAIGPSIKGCCYEVDGPVFSVISELERDHAKSAFCSATRQDHWMFDLQDFAHEEFIRLGVPESQIEIQALCTYCRNDLFYSFRRDGSPCGSHFNFILMKQ